MERCPHCGAAGRSGAKFCTTCGFRFVSEESAAMDQEPEHQDDQGQAEGSGHEPSGPKDVEGNSSAGFNATGLIAGWPAPPSRGEETGGASSGWPTPSANVPELAEAADPVSGDWAREASQPWSARSAYVAQAVSTNGESGGRNDGFWQPAATNASAAVAASPDPFSALDRAAHLLDELRGVIATLGARSNEDLTGAISDLEVAVNPPGALGAEERAELREVLLRARERPRDLDTVLELSQRIDGVVALMFAYDRAIAAIERSLEVLRRDPSTTPAVPSSETEGAMPGGSIDRRQETTP
jgi:hypothetical protein